MAKKNLLWFVLILCLGLTLVSCTGNIIPGTTRYSLTIGIQPTGGGTVSPGSGTKFDANTTATLTVTPAEGYVFDTWSGTDGSEVVAGTEANTYKIVMDSNKSITATFKSVPQNASLSKLAGWNCTEAINDIAIMGDYAFALSSNVLYVLDIANPAQITLKSTCPTGGTKLKLTDSYAIIIDANTLSLVDITDPNEPTQRGVFTLATDRTFKSIALEGDKVYAIVNRAYPDYGREPYLYVVSYANPDILVEVTHKSITSQAQFSKVDDLLISGNYIYIVDSYDQGVQVYNKGTLEVHSYVLDFCHIACDLPFSITLKNGYAFVAYSAAIYVIDSTDINDLKAVKTVEIAGPDNQGRAQDLCGDYLYTAAYGDGLRIFDTSDEVNPVEVAADLAEPNVYRLAHQGNYIFVAADSGVLCYLFE